MKKRTLQFKTINVDGSVIAHAMRFPLCATYKAIYRALRNKKSVIDAQIYTWVEK